MRPGSSLETAPHLSLQRQDELRGGPALTGPHDAVDQPPQEAALAVAAAGARALHLPPQQQDALLFLHRLLDGLRKGVYNH